MTAEKKSNADGSVHRETSGWDKFLLLMWKNWTSQKRHKIQIAVEILLPLLFVSILVLIRDLVTLTYHDDVINYSAIPITAKLPDIPRGFFQLGSSNQVDESYLGWPLAWAPNTSAVEDVMNELAKRTNVKVKHHGFATEQDMENYLAHNGSHLLGDFLGGVVFTNEFPANNTWPKDIKFKIRLKGSRRVRGTSQLPLLPWLTEFRYQLFDTSGPRGGNHSDPDPGYFREGFLTLQDGISRILTEKISSKSVDDVDIEMHRFPYPPYVEDFYLLALQGWLPFVMVMSFIYPALNIVKNIVHEKEKRLKESMKMMGLPNWLHWLAWFTKSFIFLTFTIIIITVFLKVRWYGQGSMAVLEHSDGTLLFFLLFVFTITSISLCFFMTVFFSKANSAGTGAGIVWFLSYLPYNFLNLQYSTLTWAQKIFSCLLSNTAISFAGQLMSRFEGTEEGIQWDNINRSVTPDDDFTLAHVFIMLAVDCVIYMLLALYIEAVFPGEFGLPLPWNFPFKKEYWCGSSRVAQNATTSGAERTLSNADAIEEEPIGLSAGIQIRGLGKEYIKDRVAVDSIHLNMYDNQITVLLGHNGAGKSTTMSMLTGLFPPTRGTALVNGFDILQDIQNVRGSMGLCPQHDVLFDDLTVKEHLDFFCRLKGYPAELVAAETDRMLLALQLEDKRNVVSSKLSGGMKRKLSVGIALCAQSKVVMLDEPTSGMDPSARRSTWDLLQKEKAGRTILLTTHFMDEADLLGDRIAIMASGQIQCCGSSLFLKKKFGAGYHLVVVKDADCDVNRITQAIGKYISDVSINQNVGAELSYLLPADQSHLFQFIFEDLEKNRRSYGISSYGASVTTMEEVFIRVGEIAAHAEESSHGLGNRNNGAAAAAAATMNNDFSSRDLLADAGNGQLRNSGLALFAQQLWAMMVKKWTYVIRNWLLLLAQVIIPVLILVITLILLRSIPGIEDSKPLTLDLDGYRSTITAVEHEMSKDNALCANLTTSYEQQFRSGSADEFSELGANRTMEEDFIDRAQHDLPGVNLHRLVGVTFSGLDPSPKTGKERVKATAWFNGQSYHTPPLSLNLIHNALLAHYTGDADFRLTVTNHPLPFTEFDKLNQGSSGSLVGFQVGFNLAFGMAFLSASFVIFLVRERETRAKHLQFVSGLNFVTYWLANMICDLLNFLLPSLLVLVTFLIFSEEGFISGPQQGRCLLIFVMFAWAMLPFMYLFSFLFSIPSSAFTRLTMLNIFTGIATLIVVTVLQIPDLKLTHVGNILDWVFLVLPNYSLGTAFNDLYTNDRALETCTRPTVQLYCKLLASNYTEIFHLHLMPNPCCKGTDHCGFTGCIDYNEDPLGWDGLGLGRILLFLFIDGIVFFTVIVLVELQTWNKIKYYFQRQRHPHQVDDVVTVEDDDVAAERELIHNRQMTVLQQDNNLIIKDLVKDYNGSFRAVDHLCLGVRRGECFGLLGINGAGKTTTFKMLTGDVEVTQGDAYLDGYSIRRNLKAVQRRLGYCPQFDAIIEEMTGRETLKMFANLRGIPRRSIGTVIEDLTDKLLLRDHIDKQVKQMSGGNKRKLSTAVALIGDPRIIFLDEPTTGMDPVARRQLWDTIELVRANGQAIVLTSHSMEECEALCTRLAIMVNGRFKCLGSAQHLKSKFGQGYTLIAKVCRSPLQHPSSGPSSRGGHVPDLTPLMTFIRCSFPGAVLKDCHQGLVHYHLPESNDLTWAKLFGIMEKAKQQFSIEDYSVGQTTLEQVFLNFAQSQISENGEKDLTADKDDATYL